MPKSSKGENRGKRRASKNVVSFLTRGPDVSPTTSPDVGTALLSPGEARRARGMHRFGITEEQWQECPKITRILRLTIGGQRKAISLLLHSEDPEVRKFLKVFFSLEDKDRRLMPLEILCLAAKVSPQYVMGQIILSYTEASKTESKLILIGETPKLLRSAAEFGKGSLGGFRDREMMLKVNGTLPTSNGGGVNIFLGDKQGDDNEEESSLEEDVFRYDQKTMDAWGERRRQLMDQLKREKSE
jgi:hypothetical protein